jgi:hypothetical protein
MTRVPASLLDAGLTIPGQRWRRGRARGSAPAPCTRIYLEELAKQSGGHPEGIRRVSGGYPVGIYRVWGAITAFLRGLRSGRASRFQALLREFRNLNRRACAPNVSMIAETNARAL